MAEDRNRAYDIHRNDDTFKSPSTTLYDIDYAILFHLKNNIAPEILENGNKIKVPIMMASGEKWAQIQSHGYLRDKFHKVMTPIILLRRESISKDDNYPTLKINNPNGANTTMHYAQIQHNNQNDWINKTHNTKPSLTYYTIPIPDFVLVNYELLIWTDLIPQMNTIVEQIVPQGRKYWGDEYKFQTDVRDYSFETMNDVGMDRVVKCNIPLEVRGRLLSEYELNESTVQKAFTVKRIDFMTETTEAEIYPDFMPKIIKFGRKNK